MAVATMQKARLAAAEREDIRREGVHYISKQDVRLDTVSDINIIGTLEPVGI